MPADQNARPLRTVERLVPRHAQKRRRKLSQRHRQNPCRLRAIENQRHLPLAAQCRNFLHRQNIAEHVRHVRADNRLCVLCDCRAEALDRIVRVKQPPSGNADIRADLIERSEIERQFSVLVGSVTDREKYNVALVALNVFEILDK